jgi:glycerol-3-phosphate cytidylyltransferase-like family protein
MKGNHRVGYINGVYDVVGSVDLARLRAARAECGYLFVGVLADEVAALVSGRTPVIPFEERLAIVRAMRGVDAAVGQMTDDLVDVWQRLRFDCFFVSPGSAAGPAHDALRALGVEVVAWLAAPAPATGPE